MTSFEVIVIIVALLIAATLKLNGYQIKEYSTFATSLLINAKTQPLIGFWQGVSSTLLVMLVLVLIFFHKN